MLLSFYQFSEKIASATEKVYTNDKNSGWDSARLHPVLSAGKSIAGLAEQVEHIFLIEFHTGLVKRIHAEHIGGNAAGEFKEIEQLAQRIGINFIGLKHHDRNAAVNMGVQRACSSTKSRDFPSR